MMKAVIFHLDGTLVQREILSAMERK